MTGSTTRRLVDDLRVVVPAWVVARVLVAAGMVAARLVAGRGSGVRPATIDQGLMAWDGGWYRLLVEVGYGDAPREAVRFFPGFALAGRVVDAILPGVADVALLVIANVAALTAMVVLRRLVMAETGERPLADRSVWLLACFPTAFVLVWGYAEALFLALSAGTFLALRRERWWWAAGLSACAGLTRPTGALLAAAALAAVWPFWRRHDMVGRLAAVAGGVVGAGGFVVWASVRFEERWIPLKVQSELRGDDVNPVVRLVDGVGDLFGPERWGDGMHIPFAVVFVVLAVVAFRTLPLRHGLFAAATLLVALGAENLNSLERYALNAFPLVIALGVVAGSRRMGRAGVLVLPVSAVLLVVLTAMASYGSYVP
jgi:hypothetical protein